MPLSNIPNPIDNQEGNSLSQDLSVKLWDGILSHEEAKQLHDKYAYKREEIDAIYENKKDEIYGFTKEHKEILFKLLPKEKTEVTKKSIEPLSSLSEKFDIPNLQEIHAELTSDGLSLSIQECLNWCNDYLENDLRDLSSSTKEKIILSIGIRIRGLMKDIKKAKSDAKNLIVMQNKKEKDPTKHKDPNNLARARWIINGKIQNVLKEIITKILPSAFMIQEYDKAEDKDVFIEQFVSATKYKEYTIMAETSSTSYLWLNTQERKTVTIESQKETARHQIKWQLATIEAMFNAPVNEENWEFDQKWLPNKLAQIHALHTNIWIHAKRFATIWGDISKLSKINLLNEADKKIERKSMLLLMWGIAWHIAIEGWPALLASVVPGAWTAAWAIVWSFLWAGIDIADTFSSKDAILELLKKAGVIEEEFDIEKSLLDNIMAGAWLLPWITVAAKSAKLSFLMAKFWVSWSEVIKSMDAVLPLLKWSKNTKTKSIVKWATEDVPKHIQDANALLDTPARIAKAKALLWINKFSDKIEKTILEAHNMTIKDILKPGERLTSLNKAELIQRLNIRKALILRKAGLDGDQVRILMKNKICWLPDIKIDEVELWALSRMVEWDSYMLKALQRYPEFGKLIASFWEEGWDIWKILWEVTLDDNAMQNFGSIVWEVRPMLTEADVSKLTTFLSAHWRKLPDGIDIDEFKEYDEIVLSNDDKALTSLIDILREIKLSKWQEKAVDVVVSNSDDTTEVVSITKKLEWFDLIEVDYPEVFAVYEAIQNGDNFWGLLKSIDFKAEWILDALDYVAENCRWLIAESQLASIARFTQKSPDELKANLEFTDWEAGVTIEFMRNIFRIQQEVTTKRKIIDDPFEIEVADLARLTRRVFLDKWPEISQYIQNTPELQESIRVLKKADFGDPEFIINHMPKLSDFYDAFWKEALVKLISDVFKLEDIELNKVIWAIENYDWALIFANKAQASKDKAEFINLNETLLSVWVPLKEITSSMRDSLVVLKKSLESDLIDKDFESIAYLVGRNEGISYLVSEIGDDNFIKLLNTLNVKISDESIDKFFQIIKDISKGI